MTKKNRSLGIVAVLLALGGSLYAWWALEGSSFPLLGEDIPVEWGDDTSETVASDVVTEEEGEPTSAEEATSVEEATSAAAGSEEASTSEGTGSISTSRLTSRSVSPTG